MTPQNLDEKTDGAVSLSQLVRHLIYGDIEEASLAILAEDCPSSEEYNAMDTEQQTRLAAAATVAACIAGMLHPSGFILPNVYVDASPPLTTQDHTQR